MPYDRARMAAKTAIEKHTSLPEKYKHINFKPPEAVAAAAARGLEYRQKASPSNKGGLTPVEAAAEGIGSGVQRAVNLQNRDNISPKVIGQMRNFLSRSEKASKVAEGKEPWNDKGHVAWLLWGGDPGKSWVEQVYQQMLRADSEESTRKKSKPGSSAALSAAQKAMQARDVG